MGLITKQEASARLAISVRTLEGIIKRGNLAVYRIGPKCVRIDEDDLDAYVEARRILHQQPGKKPEAVHPCLYVPGMKVV